MDGFRPLRLDISRAAYNIYGTIQPCQPLIDNNFLFVLFPLFRCVLQPLPADCGKTPSTFYPSPKPICVVKRTRDRKCPNVFYDNRGFPVQSHDLTSSSIAFTEAVFFVNANTLLPPSMMSTPPSFQSMIKPNTGRNSTPSLTFPTLTSQRRHSSTA